MNIGNRLAAILGILLFCVGSAAARAEHHHATRLGNPATRFAPPMYTPQDLRKRFSDPKLHKDFIAVLQQWGWPGHLDDFFAAGLTNPIEEWEIPVGTTMPFMSSREGGKAICLRNVTWAGKGPIHAYTFKFASNGRIYRCIVPKPCSNFFVEDIGAVPFSGLEVDCDVPDKNFLAREFRVCLTVRNTGNIPEPHATVSLPIPAGATVTAITDDGQIADNSVVWNIHKLAPGGGKQVCVVLKAPSPTRLDLSGTASSPTVAPVKTECNTEVIGVSGMLLETSDDPDPVSVGDTTTYTVKVTNQGTADDGHVQVIVAVGSELVPVSASSAGTIDGQVVTFPEVPTLGPKQSVTFTVVAKGVTEGDARTTFSLSSDILTLPVHQEESTEVY